MGLLMVEALLVPEGAPCISLGVQTPIEDIRRAALAHDAQVVALSFSAAFPVRQAGDGLAALRRQLPPIIAVWAGGEMTRRVRKTLPGVLLVPGDLAGTRGALEAWRSALGRSAFRTGAVGRRQRKKVSGGDDEWRQARICGSNPTQKWSCQVLCAAVFAKLRLRQATRKAHD